jgi:hypothetical protein
MDFKEIPGYKSDEEIKKIVKDASIDLGSSALDLLEERLHRSNARLLLRYAEKITVEAHELADRIERAL